MRLLTTVPLALVALLFMACGGRAASSRHVEASARDDRWELRLSIPGEVRSGRLMEVDLSLKNVSKETLRVHSGCWWFDLVVFDEGGAQVFTWSDHIVETEYGGQDPECPLMFRDLAPSETPEGTVSFRVEDAGEYTVRALPPSEAVGSSGVPIAVRPEAKVRAR